MGEISCTLTCLQVDLEFSIGFISGSILLSISLYVTRKLFYTSPKCIRWKIVPHRVVAFLYIEFEASLDQDYCIFMSVN